jgi:catechol-2,3-dioxygenase
LVSQQVDLDLANRNINEFNGLEVNGIIAKVHLKTGKVKESKVGVKIVLGVEHS